MALQRDGGLSRDVWIVEWDVFEDGEQMEESLERWTCALKEKKNLTKNQ